MIFCAALGVLLGLSQGFRTTIIGGVFAGERDWRAAILTFLIFITLWPFFLGANDLQSWALSYIGEFPNRGQFDLFTIAVVVFAILVGEVLRDAVHSRLSVNDVKSILPSGLTTREHTAVMAASLLYDHRSGTDRLVTALRRGHPRRRADRIEDMAEILSFERLSIDDLPLMRMSRSLSRNQREAFVRYLASVGVELRAIGTEELAWLRWIGRTMNIESKRVSEILSEFGFKSMDAKAWDERFRAGRASHKAGNWAEPGSGSFAGGGSSTHGSAYSRTYTPPAMGTRTAHLITLGLGDNASGRDIVRAYRRLAKEHHPDKYMQDDIRRREAEITMRSLNAAYAALKRA